MILTADNIFDTLRADYEEHFGVAVAYAKGNEPSLLDACKKYKGNYTFVRAMWTHYIENDSEERWGWTFDNFLTVRRLNQYARIAYKTLTSGKQTEDDPMYFYKCEKCGRDNNLYTPQKQESLAKPCNYCSGRMVYARSLLGD